jgi:hypothetical protein
MHRDGSIVPLIHAGSDGESSLVPNRAGASVFIQLAGKSEPCVDGNCRVRRPASSLPNKSQKLDALVSAAQQIVSRVRNT